MLNIINSKITFKLLSTIISLFMILLFIMSLYISAYFSKTYSEKAISSSTTLLESTSNHIDEKIDKLILTSTLLVADNSIRTLLDWDRKYEKEIRETGTASFVNDSQRYTLAKEFLYNLEILNTDVSSSTLITNRSVYLNYAGAEIRNVNFPKQYPDMEWYKKSYGMKGSPLLISIHSPYQTIATDRLVISVARSLFDAISDNYLATLLVDINVKNIKNLLTQVRGENGEFLVLIDENGKVICSDGENDSLEKQILNLPIFESSKAELEFESKEKEKYIFNYITSESTGWRLGQVIPEEVAMKESGSATLLFIQGMGIIVVVIMIMTSIYLMYLVSVPIKNLNSRIKKIGSGDLSDYENQYRNRQDEIGQLSRTIYQIKGNLSDLIIKVANMMNRQREAQLKALQSQINPHFILNTLNSIQMMAKIDKADNVVYMLEKLGSLFKTYISTNRNLVSIREEEKSIATYIAIQKMRYGDKILYQNLLPEEILDYFCIKFVVQPIVENAIIHGIETRRKKGEVCLGGTLLDERHILLYVEDNGAGIDEETLALLTKRLEDEDILAIDTDRNIGLFNVHNRLRLYYGKEYGVKIHSKAGVGTRIEIIIPVIKKNNNPSL